MRRIVFALSSLAAVAAPVYAQGVVIEAPNLSLPILIGLALIDSINPCVIGVLILLMTVLLKVGNRKAILSNGAAYTAGVYFTYLIGGMTLLTVFNLARTLTAVSQALYVAIGALVLFAGLLETKDFFWYGRWYSLSIPAGLVHMVEERASGAHASLAAAMSFGFVVTLIELPCTGAPYLAVLTLMSQGGLNYVTALPMLLLYNLVFVLPLLVIIYLAYKGMEMKRLESLRKEHRGLMRLAIGLALLAVGVWIVTAVADVFVPLVLFLSGAIALMAVLKYVFKV
ncbi:MAG: GAP family protein [Candidatus Aenigmatarchaeota archaeon]|nr:MAG: GAP family protein [Candidatus Aenigmarchaeota archaeon]